MQHKRHGTQPTQPSSALHSQRACNNGHHYTTCSCCSSSSRQKIRQGRAQSQHQHRDGIIEFEGVGADSRAESRARATTRSTRSKCVAGFPELERDLIIPLKGANGVMADGYLLEV